MPKTLPPIPLPSTEQIHQAIYLYLAKAYDESLPASVRKLLPPDSFSPTEYLMSDAVERNPDNAPLAEVRSFALRLGNAHYPHMKLRISRPPNPRVYLFSVDSHDAFLCAPAASPDHAALEQLKQGNAQVASAVEAAWQAADLPTEKTFLRQRLLQAKVRKNKPNGPEPRRQN